MFLRKNNHYLFELQKLKRDDLATTWLCRKFWLRIAETVTNEWQKSDLFLKVPFKKYAWIFWRSTDEVQTIDEILHWNLTKNWKHYSNKILMKILRTGFRVKLRFAQICFGVFPLFTGLLYIMKKPGATFL